MVSKIQNARQSQLNQQSVIVNILDRTGVRKRKKRRRKTNASGNINSRIPKVGMPQAGYTPHPPRRVPQFVVLPENTHIGHHENKKNPSSVDDLTKKLLQRMVAEEGFNKKPTHKEAKTEIQEGLKEEALKAEELQESIKPKTKITPVGGDDDGSDDIGGVFAKMDEAEEEERLDLIAKIVQIGKEMGDRGQTFKRGYLKQKRLKYLRDKYKRLMDGVRGGIDDRD